MQLLKKTLISMFIFLYENEYACVSLRISFLEYDRKWNKLTLNLSVENVKFTRFKHKNYFTRSINVLAVLFSSCLFCFINENSDGIWTENRINILESIVTH